MFCSVFSQSKVIGLKDLHRLQEFTSQSVSGHKHQRLSVSASVNFIIESNLTRAEMGNFIKLQKRNLIRRDRKLNSNFQYSRNNLTFFIKPERIDAPAQPVDQRINHIESNSIVNTGESVAIVNFSSGFG